MKKITIKLNYEGLECFLKAIERYMVQHVDSLVKAVLTELYARLNPKLLFSFKNEKSIQLKASEAIALKKAIGTIPLTGSNPYVFSVMNPVYETIDKSLS